MNHVSHLPRLGLMTPYLNFKNCHLGHADLDQSSQTSIILSHLLLEKKKLTLIEIEQEQGSKKHQKLQEYENAYFKVVEASC